MVTQLLCFTQSLAAFCVDADFLPFCVYPHFDVEHCATVCHSVWQWFLDLHRQKHGSVCGDVWLDVSLGHGKVKENYGDWSDLQVASSWNKSYGRAEFVI